MFLQAVVVLMLTLRPCHSIQLGQPSDMSETYLFEVLADLFYNPNEEFKVTFDNFLSDVGLKGWSQLILQGPHGTSNREYDSVAKVMPLLFNPDVTIPPAFKNLTLDCKLCLGITFGLKAAIGASNFTFVEGVVTKLCVKVIERQGMRADLLCKSTVEKYAPYVEMLLDKMIFLSKFCPYMNACLNENPKNVGLKKNNTKTQRADGNVSEVDSRKVKKEEKEEKDVLRIAQLTDIHFEEKYKENTSTKCGLPVCCLEKYGKGTAGRWGDYKCDTNALLLEAFADKIVSLKADIVIFTGDAAPHTVWEQTLDSHKRVTTATANLLQKKFSSVFPVLGSTDNHPSHLFSTKLVPDTKEYLKNFVEAWSSLAGFTDEDKKNIKNGGFYSKNLADNLKLLVFNSAYMYTMNFLNVMNHEGRNPESKDFHRFVEVTLKESEDESEKVILAFHHPMGTFDFIVSESIWLEKVLLKYKDTVVLVVNGHTHYNEFRVLYDQAKKPSVVTFAAPSLSSNKQRNPSMRLYHLNKKSFALVDYQQYSLDLSQVANVDTEDVSGHIHESYSAKAEYQLPDLSAASWHSLINRMQEDDDLLLKHMRHFYTDAKKIERVTRLQKRRHTCRLKEAHYNEFKSCVRSTKPSTPTITFTRPAFTEPNFNSKAANFIFNFLTFISVMVMLLLFIS